jgi:alkylation response protein AidB-like acyl-CoA dehydrogenase
LDFALPADLTAYLDELDRFIISEIKPLEEADDNIRFFDHRREWARTDFDNGGLPRHEWEVLLRRAKNLADAAGHLRFAIPKRYGGKDGSNLWMAVIREHFAAKGLGLHNDLQNEHSIVGNLPLVTMLDRYGRDDQKAMIEGSISGKYRITFGLTEPQHGSDATHMETRAVPATRDNVKGWIINGEKMWTTGMHVATHCALFARPAMTVTRAASAASWCRRRARASGSRNTCGPSTCRPIIRASVSPTCSCLKMRSSVRSGAGCRWRNASCTRTAFGRPQAHSALRSIASMRA